MYTNDVPQSYNLIINSCTKLFIIFYICICSIHFTCMGKKSIEVQSGQIEQHPKWTRERRTITACLPWNRPEAFRHILCSSNMYMAAQCALYTEHENLWGSQTDWWWHGARQMHLKFLTLLMAAGGQEVCRLAPNERLLLARAWFVKRTRRKLWQWRRAVLLCSHSDCRSAHAIKTCLWPVNDHTNK